MAQAFSVFFESVLFFWTGWVAGVSYIHGAGRGHFRRLCRFLLKVRKRARRPLIPSTNRDVPGVTPQPTSHRLSSLRSLWPAHVARTRTHTRAMRFHGNRQSDARFQVSPERWLIYA